MVILRKMSKDHWTAAYKKVVGDGKGPLSAVHDLFEKLRMLHLTVVEEKTARR